MRLQSAVGRLENIIARNRNPSGRRDRYALGLLGVVLVVVVGMLIFTGLALPPGTPDPATAEPAKPDDSVRGIKLYRPPQQKP